MTPSQAYKAGLEVAAKVANDYDARKHGFLSGAADVEARYAADQIAATIRALPVPQDDANMVLVPREPTEKMIKAGKEACEKPWITQVALYRFGLIYRAMINAKE